MGLSLAVFGVFVVLLFFAVPLGFSMTFAGLTVLLADGNGTALGAVPQIFNGLNSITLLAVPFFVLSGSLMEKGNISAGLVDFSRAWVGHYKAGLAYVCVVSCMLFSTVSGTTIAVALAFGNLLAPAMRRDGYTNSFIAALQACGGTIGPIIPPSVLFVMYASISGVSIGGLFLGGVIPGVLMGLSLMVVSYFLVRNRDIKRTPPMPVKQRIIVTLKSIPALLMPVIIIGGTLSGFCGPSEAGTVACVYAILVGSLFYRGIKLKDLPKIFADAAANACACFLMLGLAGVMNYTLTRFNFGRLIGEFLGTFIHSGTGLLLVIAIFLLLQGTLMDTMAALIIFGPIFYPLAGAYGVSPIHLGVLIVVCLVIGQVTPPVGILLSVTTKLHGIRMQESFKDLFPMIVALVICVVIVLFLPPLTTWLPSLMP